VQDAIAANIRAALGVALREFPLKRGFADYLLYVDGKEIGVIEAKPEGFPLKGSGDAIAEVCGRFTKEFASVLPAHRETS